MSCLFYIIVVAIGSICTGLSWSMKLVNLMKCPNGCICDKNNYYNEKYNIDCQKVEQNQCVNLTDLNTDCVKHHEFNISVSREQFKPVLSLCGLDQSCSMNLYLDTSSHERFEFIFNNFNILCLRQLTGLYLKGSTSHSVLPDSNKDQFGTDDTAQAHLNPGRAQIGPYGRGERMGEEPIRGHDWKMEQLESTGNDFSVNSIPKDLLTNLHQLKKLNLGSNHIKYIGDGTFSEAGLDKLTTIDLHNNYLVIVPTNLFRSLPSIKTINLNGNTIEYLAELAFCSQSLSTLTHIDLSDNDLTSLSSNIFCNLSNIEHINFGNNLISKIEPDVMDSITLSNIEYLSLSGNRIVSIPKLTHEVSHLQKLTKFDISNNRLEDLKNVNIDTFLQLPKISEINLSVNRIKSIDANSFKDNYTIPLYNVSRENGFKVNLDHNQIKVINTDAFNCPVMYNIGLLSFRYNGLHRIEGNITDWRHPGWFPVTIILAYNKLNTVPSAFFRHFPSLKRFYLQNNDIFEISEFTFKDSCCLNLTHLDMRHNKIAFIHQDAFLSSKLPSLQYVNLKYNQLTNIKPGTFDHLISLRYLDISSNKLLTLFPISPANHQHLSVILRDNLITSADIFSFGLSTNKSDDQCGESKIQTNTSEKRNCVIDLKGNNISQITNNADNNWNMSFPTCHVLFDKRFLINPDPLLQDLPLSASSLTCTDMLLLSYILTKLRPKFLCSCVIYDYVRLLEAGKMSWLSDTYKQTVCYTKDSTPINGSWFLDSEPVEYGVNLLCNVMNCTNCSSCTCLYNVKSRETLINCSGAKLSHFPQILSNRKNVHVNLSKNEIQHLPKHEGLSRIEKLDLSYNRISSISRVLPLLSNIKLMDLSYNLLNNAVTLNESLSLPNLESIYLAGNPISCNCEGKVIKEHLLDKFMKIKDINAITCSAPPELIGQSIIKLKSFNCSDTVNPTFETPDYRGLLPTKQSGSDNLSTMAASVVLTVLAIVLFAIIFYKYRKYIKVFLYSRFGWRFGYKYSDEKKLYDVFISHSSLDSEWVLDTLLPRLENNEPAFRVTVHQRDFLPGNSILKNIANAITNTKAVILVVSNNFIESEWCKFEFREAVTEAIKMQYPQIIVILLEPIEVDTYVGEELLLYLRTHTYIEWNSSYFWPRLMMSLPDPTTNKEKYIFRNSDSKEIFNESYRKTAEPCRY